MKITPPPLKNVNHVFSSIFVNFANQFSRPVVNKRKRYMKKIKVIAAISLLALGVSLPASAQYYEIASQLPSLLSPALSGSMKYKGYVDISGTAGLGNNRANFIGVSTSQGYQYSSWFFMGVGLGVDVAMSHHDDNIVYDRPYPSYLDHDATKTKAMVPVFTDFRFNFGQEKSLGGFIDLKIGAAWMLGSSYLVLDRACMSNATQFYLKPTIGVRLPINGEKPRQAFNIGLSYQLLTSNNNYNWNNNSVTLNNLGVTIAYEW